jgi:hypothetical protein
MTETYSVGTDLSQPYGCELDRPSGLISSAVASADPEDRSVDLVAISAYRRTIRASGREPSRFENYPPKPAARRCAVKPRRPPDCDPGAARARPTARAVHSRTAHCGARKRDDGNSGGGEPPPPRWLLITDIPRPRIVVAAVETVNGLATFRKDETTGKPWIETTGASRAEALTQLSRMVRERGGYPAWSAYNKTMEA